MAERYVIDLVHRAALDREQAGGKGAGCARLIRFGYSVPNGFVLTVRAFHEFMTHSGVEMPQAYVHTDARHLTEIRERLMAAQFPDTVRHAVVNAYRRLGGRVAVRSSMKCEDGDAASFAGQLETFLNVEGDAGVLDSIKSCYTALYSDRFLQYRARREGLREGDRDAFEMAVVIQRMIDAQASGVAFTADPLTGQRCVIIESVPGSGDKIVDGHVDPDRYVIDVRGVISEQRLAHVHNMSSHQVLMLAEHAKRIAARMKRPQDIEWVWNGEQFYFLQSRPITTLLEMRIYSRRLVSDMAPGLIKPLVWSTNTVGMMNKVFGSLFVHFADVRGIRFESFVRRIASRLYADMTAFGELLERIGLPANLFELVTLDEDNIRHRPPLNWRLLRACMRSMPFIVRHARFASSIERFIRAHRRRLQSLNDRQWSSCSEQEITDAAEKLIAMHGESQWHMWIAAMNMMVRKRILARLVAKYNNSMVACDLLCGLNSFKALTPNDKIEGLAAEATQLDAESRRVLLTGDEKKIRRALARNADGAAFLKRVDAFIDSYAFLSANGTDFTIAPWIENQAPVWKALVRVLKNPSPTAAAHVIEAKQRERSRVRAQLNPFVQRFFDVLLSSTLSYFDLRERMSLIMSEDAYQIRRVFLALGSHLVARGILEARDDIFYLYFDEVRDIVHRTIPEREINKIVAMREKEMMRNAKIEPPDTIAGGQVSQHDTPLQDERQYLVGISGSSGTAMGRARIIRDPVNAPLDLGKKDILVVPFTDIGWTPLFMSIGGIVAETGGQLSHTSIVAREYGLPAVVSVKNATRLIREGQRIIIDGSNGRVYLKTRRPRSK